MTIGKKVISSLSWLAITRFAAQLITWTITIIVIRLLTPKDYGVMAMAMIEISFFSLLNEMGMGSVLVQKQNLDRQTIEHVFGLLLVINIALYLLLFLGAPWFAEFFGELRLTKIIQVLALQFLLGSFSVVPASILSRNMDFRRKSLVDFSSMITGSFFTLIFALLGQGVWSLVFGQLISVTVRTIGMNLAIQYWCKPRFSLSGIRNIWNFGGLVALNRVLWFFYSQADTFIIGKLLGNELLGLYSVAKDLARLPMDKVMSIFNEVAFSAFSFIQHDRDLVNAHFCKAVRILSFFAFPIFFGISSMAPEIVQILLGPKWNQCILPLQALSIIVPLQILSSITFATLFGIGRPDISVYALILACIVMPLALAIGVKWGLNGVSFTWVLVYPLHFLVVLKLSTKVLGMRIIDYLNAAKIPAITSTIVYLAVVSLREFLTTALMLGPVFQLVILIILGATIYSSCVLVMQRAVLNETLALFRG